MHYIRKAEARDISRIAEILVFTKRVNFRPIFQDDAYSFGKLQVLPVAQELMTTPSLLDTFWVYDDGIVKGLIRIEGAEIKTLYVDHFFQNQRIGEALLTFAVKHLGTQYLWALEKNTRALSFYARHDFIPNGEWQYEEGTVERLLKLVLCNT